MKILSKVSAAIEKLLKALKSLLGKNTERTLKTKFAMEGDKGVRWKTFNRQFRLKGKVRVYQLHGIKFLFIDQVETGAITIVDADDLDYLRVL